MITASLVLASLAATLHVGIFVVESVLWTRPVVWRAFGVRSQADAQTTRPLAYNQGFYNLFLALGAAVGVGMVATGQGTKTIGWVTDGAGTAAAGGGAAVFDTTVTDAAVLGGAGSALVVFTMGCMLAASVVLLTTGRGYLRAALVQGSLPLVALVLLLLAALA